MRSSTQHHVFSRDNNLPESVDVFHPMSESDRRQVQLEIEALERALLILWDGEEQPGPDWSSYNPQVLNIIDRIIDLQERLDMEGIA